MGMYKVGSVAYCEKEARIYRNPDYDEYVVKMYIDGIHLKESDYFASDVDDAWNTAREMLKGY